MAVHAIWVAAIVLAVAAVRQIRTLVRSRDAAVRSERDRWEQRALEILSTRPATSAIEHAAAELFGTELSSVQAAHRSQQATVRIIQAIDSSGARAANLPVIECAVRHWNDLGELVDNSLLRTHDLFVRRPDLHRDALVELTLLEPLVWHESLVAGRGRWGYRVMELGALARSQRCNSFYGEVLGEVQLAGVVVVKGLSRFGRARGRVRVVLRRREISPRTKRRQKRRAGRLRRSLLAEGRPALAAEPTVPW